MDLCGYFPHFSTNIMFNLYVFLPACLHSFRQTLWKPWIARVKKVKPQVGTMPWKQREAKQRQAQKRWSEKRGQVKNVMAAKVQRESNDAKWKHNNRTESKERRKERVSKMCLTAGACVGVMGDPAGPRGNLQVCALALQDLAGALQWRCHNCCFTRTHTYEHTNTYKHTEDKQLGIKFHSRQSPVVSSSSCLHKIYLFQLKQAVKASFFIFCSAPPFNFFVSTCVG